MYYSSCEICGVHFSVDDICDTCWAEHDMKNMNHKQIRAFKEHVWARRELEKALEES